MLHRFHKTGTSLQVAAAKGSKPFTRTSHTPCAGVVLGPDGTCCRLALQALAAGADVNATYTTPGAQRLVQQTQKLHRPAGGSNPTITRAAPASPALLSPALLPSQPTCRHQVCNRPVLGLAAGPASSCQQHHSTVPIQQASSASMLSTAGCVPPGQPDSAGSCSACSVLHAASASGNCALLEFLLQNGASWQQTDAAGRSALHYALLHDAVGCAKQLLLRGGALLADMRDNNACSAMDLCLSRGRVEDEELFLLLSAS